MTCTCPTFSTSDSWTYMRLIFWFQLLLLSLCDGILMRIAGLPDYNPPSRRGMVAFAIIASFFGTVSK